MVIEDRLNEDISGGGSVSCIIKFTPLYLRCPTELSRFQWMPSTNSSFDLYDGINTMS